MSKNVHYCRPQKPLARISDLASSPLLADRGMIVSPVSGCSGGFSFNIMTHFTQPICGNVPDLIVPDNKAWA